MKVKTGLFRAIRKRLMTTDNDMGMFRQKLDELVDQKDSLSEEEVTARVNELKEITNDLPDDEGKAKLVRFLDDFNSVKEQDAAVAKEAAKAVADQFEKLDTAAMQDVPGAEEPAATEEPEPATEPLVEGAAPEAVEGDTEVTEEIAEETEAPAEETEAEDADPNPEYTMEEIYQFIKRRMAEDAEAEEAGDIPEETAEEDPEAEDGLDGLNELIHSAKEGPAGCSYKANQTADGDQEEMEEEKDEVVTDHAPHIPVTVKDNAPKGGLAALIDLAKRG